MNRGSLLSGWACAVLAAALLVAPVRASAGIVTATIPGSGFLSVAPATLGTFHFMIPVGEAAASAQVAFNNIDVAFVNSANFFLDGILLGSAGFGFGQNLAFSLSNLSVLADGAAVLAWDLGDYFAGCPCVIPNGGETLTIATTAPVPEPTTLSLVALSLLVLGAVRVIALGSDRLA
jgi:hypothetical protein